MRLGYHRDANGERIVKNFGDSGPPRKPRPPLTPEQLAAETEWYAARTLPTKK